MEHHGIEVDDKHTLTGGLKRITTPDGFVFPLIFQNGLTYLRMRPFKDDKYDQLPHVMMTSDQIWDPRTFDDSHSPEDYTSMSTFPRSQLGKDYDLQGKYIANRAVSEPTEFKDFWMSDEDYAHSQTVIKCMKSVAHTSSSQAGRSIQPQKKNFQHLQRFFAWLPSQLIERTFRNSTQYGYMPNSPDGNLFTRFHAPNPALNVHRFNDDILTDKIFSDTPAVDSGYTAAQIFFGRKSHLVHIEPATTQHKFIHALQNFV